MSASEVWPNIQDVAIKRKVQRRGFAIALKIAKVLLLDFLFAVVAAHPGQDFMLCFLEVKTPAPGSQKPIGCPTPSFQNHDMSKGING